MARTFGLAKLIENQPDHRPKRREFHLADEYQALGNTQVAYELRRHLRGHGKVFVNYMKHHRG